MFDWVRVIVTKTGGIANADVSVCRYNLNQDRWGKSVVKRVGGKDKVQKFFFNNAAVDYYIAVQIKKKRLIKDPLNSHSHSLSDPHRFDYHLEVNAGFGRDKMKALYKIYESRQAMQQAMEKSQRVNPSGNNNLEQIKRP